MTDEQMKRYTGLLRDKVTVTDERQQLQKRCDMW